MCDERVAKIGYLGSGLLRGRLLWGHQGGKRMGLGFDFYDVDLSHDVQSWRYYLSSGLGASLLGGRLLLGGSLLLRGSLRATLRGTDVRLFFEKRGSWGRSRNLDLALERDGGQ